MVCFKERFCSLTCVQQITKGEKDWCTAVHLDQSTNFERQLDKWKPIRAKTTQPNSLFFCAGFEAVCVCVCFFGSYHSWGCLVFWSRQSHCHICPHTNTGRCCHDTGLVWNSPPQYSEEYKSLETKRRGGERRKNDRKTREDDKDMRRREALGMLNGQN